jgi:hypothetical protein
MAYGPFSSNSTKPGETTMTHSNKTGRFIYARYKTLERLYARLDDMYSEGEMSPCEAQVETIRDHNGRVAFHAITIA